MRIIAGKYGSRPLRTLADRRTRPTTDKIRGSLFNMIGPYLDGGRVLDLYAGTGALAIEAVSRGADSAILVERDRRAQTVIAANIAMTQEPERFQLLRQPADAALSRLVQDSVSFGYVFLDPPYAQGQLSRDMSRLSQAGLLAPAATIICETQAVTPLPERIATLTKKKEKIHGITKITLYS